MSCDFCDIVAGDGPTQRLVEDELTLAFMDVNPATPGHALVIPKVHAVDVFDVTPEVLAALARTAQRVARAARAGLGCAGVNLIQSSGAAAFQSVFHIHIHVVPRYRGDGVRLPWVPRPGDPAAIAGAADQLRAALARGGASGPPVR